MSGGSAARIAVGATNAKAIAIVIANKVFAWGRMVPPGWREILTPKAVRGRTSFEILGTARAEVRTFA